MAMYHAGELAVQARVGVQAEAQQLGKSISSIATPAAREFLRSQQLAIVASTRPAIANTADGNGQVWASLVTGKPGFMQAVAQLLRIEPIPVPSDPLLENLLRQDDVGLLAIDLATQRRLRVNGKAVVHPDGSIQVKTQQVYFNCPKYIQVRHLKTDSSQQSLKREFWRADTLSSQQQDWIAQADTFFIASLHPEGGADASHRGGYPGFVNVVNANKLVFPDYAGNHMFNTLGNIILNPLAGLLFIDFEHGTTLQLTGKARILWDGQRAAAFAGAERLIAFQIDQVLETTDATSLRWRFGDYSPFNPR